MMEIHLLVQQILKQRIAIFRRFIIDSFSESFQQFFEVIGHGLRDSFLELLLVMIPSEFTKCNTVLFDEEQIRLEPSSWRLFLLSYRSRHILLMFYSIDRVEGVFMIRLIFFIYRSLFFYFLLHSDQVETIIRYLRVFIIDNWDLLFRITYGVFLPSKLWPSIILLFPIMVANLLLPSRVAQLFSF